MLNPTQKKTLSVLAALGLIGSLAVAAPAMADGFRSGVVIDIRGNDGFRGDRGLGYRDVDFRVGDRVFDRIEKLRDRIRHEIHEGELDGWQAREFIADLNDIDRDARRALQWRNRDGLERANFRLDRLASRLESSAHGRGFGRGDHDGRGWGDRDEGYRHRF